MSRITTLTLVGVLLVLFVACGGGPTPPQATAVPAATLAPAATQAPAATNAPAPTATEPLSPTLQANPAATEPLSPTLEVSPTSASSASNGIVITGSAATTAELSTTVDAFRVALGGVDNDGNPGSQGSGFRSINWDGVPDNLASPNDYPPDFFNAATPPRARGIILHTPGTSLQVSAKPGNPTNTPVRFGNINPQYPDIFKTYSPERLFSPIGSNIVELEFFVPGTNIPAVTRGYGAVYTNVRQDKTDFEYFDIQGNSLGKYKVPLSEKGLSFLGVVFPEPVVHKVRIVYGNSPLGPNDGGDINVAVMDDFIYGEPQAIPTGGAPATIVAPPPSATESISPTAGAAGFTQLGSALNRDKNAAGTDQQLTLGSTFAGAEYIPWATWAEKQGNTQQIFVSRVNNNAWEPQGASLNIHSNVVAEHPSIDFAGQDRTVPWTTWYEPSPGFGGAKQVFASRFNKDSGLWVPSGADRGNNEPSLNIHTNKDAEDPVLVGGTTNPANPPSPWVCWQEDSAHSNAVQIFVSHAVKDDSALGGFKWQPVGLNRGGSGTDAEPSLNVDFAHSDGEHCWITFAGEKSAVPWVVWDEISGGKSGKVFVARAVADAQAIGGFHWEFVPTCTGAADEDQCALNVNPAEDANDPFIASGSLSGGAPSPWVVWTEVGPNSKTQVFVSRLDPDSKSKFLHVGGSLNVNPDSNAEGPSITFLGNVPYVAWSEQVGNGARVFVRHLEGDPQAGNWVLDTPNGLAVDKSKPTNYPIIHWATGGRVDVIWREGDPAAGASQIVVCQSGKQTSFFDRLPGLAMPFLQNASCE